MSRTIDRDELLEIAEIGGLYLDGERIRVRPYESDLCFALKPSVRGWEACLGLYEGRGDSPLKAVQDVLMTELSLLEQRKNLLKDEIDRISLLIDAREALEIARIRKDYEGEAE